MKVRQTYLARPLKAGCKIDNLRGRVPRVGCGSPGIDLPANGVVCPCPQMVQTRFLYPFFLRRGATEGACEALLAAEAPMRKGLQKVWEVGEVHPLYREELLDHVADFLFPERHRPGGSRYLRLAEAFGNHWFKYTVAVPKGGRSIPVHLAPLAGVELFLTGYGVGVLSIALACAGAELDRDVVEDLNYRLAQVRPQTAARLRSPHPSEDTARWTQLSDGQRTAIPPAPAPDTPLYDRLGKPGGEFILAEAAERLLQPLAPFGLVRVQQQFSVYTVVHFGSDADLQHEEVRAALAPLLSALAQIEEPAHAGCVGDEPAVANAILNRRHWVGCGLMGAAHLVSDQPPPDDGYNSARAPRVLVKYFVPFLLALLQRYALQRIVADAAQTPGSAPGDRVAELEELRSQVLEFARHGHLAQVSHRDVIHRYYQLCQEGLRVRGCLEEARCSTSDMFQKHTAARQVELASSADEHLAATRELQARVAEGVEATRQVQESMSEHIRVVADVQRLVEWLEVIVVAYYTSAMVRDVSEHWVRGHPDLIGALVLASAVLSGGITWLVIRRLQRRSATSPGATATSKPVAAESGKPAPTTKRESSVAAAVESGGRDSGAAECGASGERPDTVAPGMFCR